MKIVRELFYLPVLIPVMLAGLVCIFFNADDTYWRELFLAIEARIEGSKP